MRDEADTVHLFVMFGGLCCFILGALSADNVFRVPQMRIAEWYSAPVQTVRSDSVLFNTMIGVIIAVSLLVSVAYFSAVGYNLFLQGIAAQVGGYEQSEDIAGQRLQAYS